MASQAPPSTKSQTEVGPESSAASTLSEHTRRDSVVVGDVDPADVEKAIKEAPQPTKEGQSWEVFLDESDDPKKRSTAQKWLIVFVLATSATCVTCASSVVSRASPCPKSTGHTSQSHDLKHVVILIKIF